MKRDKNETRFCDSIFRITHHASRITHHASFLMLNPLEIKKTGPNEITVRWDDGHVSIYSIKYLRSECLCANCVSEVTGLRILDPRTVADDLTVLSAEHVGRYGVKFLFSDRHDDGIYTWERLRELCLCDECKTAKEDLGKKV